LITTKINTQISILENQLTKGLDAKGIKELSDATFEWAERTQKAINLLDVETIEKSLVDITNSLNENKLKLKPGLDSAAKTEIELEIKKLTEKSNNLKLQLDDANLIQQINNTVLDKQKTLQSLLLEPELNIDSINQISSEILKLSNDLANVTIEASQKTADGVNLSAKELKDTLSLELLNTKNKILEGQNKPIQETTKKLYIFRKEVEKVNKEVAKTDKSEWENIKDILTSAITEFNISDLISKNNEVADSVKNIEDSYKETFATIGKELKDGAIDYESYVDKIASAENERLSKIKETESERSNFSSLANQSISNAFGKLQEQMNLTTTQILAKAVESGGGVLSVGQAVSDSFTTVIGSIGAGFGKALADGQVWWKALLTQVLNGVQVMMNAYSAALFLQKNAEFPFGVGSAVWAGMVAVANGLFELAKSQIGAESGYNPNNSKSYGKKGKSDTVQLWVNPNEAILTEKMTQTNKDLIDYWFKGKSTKDFFKDNYQPSLSELKGLQFIDYSKLDFVIDKKIKDRLNFNLAKNVNSNFKEKTIINNVSVIEKESKLSFEHNFTNVKLNNNDIEFAVNRSIKSKIRRG